MRLSDPAGLIRAARRHADMSQRELAKAAGVAPSVVSRIEAERCQPKLFTVERLLRAAGFAMQAVTKDGHVIDVDRTYQDRPQVRDASDRCFPAHLDVREPTAERQWWYYFRDTAGVKSPLVTFGLNRSVRDGWRRQDGRGCCDMDQRLDFPYAVSEVWIPGYRPIAAAFSAGGYGGY